MTTGRINQVTILSRAPEGHGRPPAEQAAEQCTRRAALERPRLGSRSRGYDRFPSTIQLPPLCSPRGGPQHNRSGARRRHRVSTYDPQEEVAVSRSRTRRVPAWACPQMSSGERWPSASNPQTPPALAALATRLSDTSGKFHAGEGVVSNLGCCAPPGPTVTARSHISRPARGWGLCNYGTRTGLTAGLDSP